MKLLCGNSDDMSVVGVHQRVFGELLNATVDKVEHYRSDYYHDARWIAEHLDGPMTFFFGYDDYGTAIGLDKSLVSMMRKNVLTVELSVDRGTWYLHITEEATEPKMARQHLR